MKPLLVLMTVAASLALGACDLQDEVEKQTGYDVGGGITDEQAEAIPKSYTQEQVIAELGEPARDYQTKGGGYEETCIYYNAKTGGDFTEWEFCFNGKGKQTTVSKY